jgi:hypothetical protein
MPGNVAIFWPMAVVAAVSIFAFFRLFLARYRSIKKRDVPLKYYEAFQGATEPEEVAVAVRHYLNVFESPVLFYAGCLAANMVGAVSYPVLIAAWWYAIFRVLQSTIHLTSNTVRYRAFAFLLAWLGLIALWVLITVAVFVKSF